MKTIETRLENITMLNLELQWLENKYKKTKEEIKEIRKDIIYEYKQLKKLEYEINENK